MTGVNKAILLGYLGKDPEISCTQDGRPIAKFSLATSESWRDKATGERREHTDWHQVVIFNEGLVRIAEQYLKKGSRIYLEGQIKTRKWTDAKGVDRYVTEIVLGAFNSSLAMLDRAERAPAAEDADYGRASAGAQPSRTEDMNDEIPF